MRDFPPERLRVLHDAPVRADGDIVLYWMLAYRRTFDNFALDRALAWSRELNKPLVILEPLRLRYPWSSMRFHRFVVQGMHANAKRSERAGWTYIPYVERSDGEGKGLLAALAAHAAVVVSDDYPCFAMPRMQAAAAKQLDVYFEVVDSNGLLPVRLAPRAYPTARGFRRFSQDALQVWANRAPDADPAAQGVMSKRWKIPSEITRRWPATTKAELAEPDGWLSSLSFMHDVAPSRIHGGNDAAHQRWHDFLEHQFETYHEDRNHPDKQATSGLSSYLHFGHIGAHRLFRELAAHEGWDWSQSAPKGTGKRDNFWHMSGSAEAFLEQLTVWRELAFSVAALDPHFDAWDGLPNWARKSMREHAGDERPYLYSLEELELSQTHDEIWNAAQAELRTEGRIHNYLRMLWGKKVLEWSPSPEKAFERLVYLNDKYALDGRDPNSYMGISWVLGRYDRAWGPERAIFGKIRYMSSDSTRRKCRVRAYLQRWNTPPQLELGRF